MQDKQVVRVGLIGYGFSGATFQVPVIVNVDGLRLTEVCSSKPALVARDYPELRVVDQPALLIASPNVDLVVIATPNTTHYPLALQALQAGKHVVVEKPFTIRTEEAMELVALAEEKGLVLSVFQNRRYDNDFLTLRQVLASGLLGTINTVESHFDRYRPAVRPRWREQALPGSGILYDLGSHVVDQALVLFGTPDSVQCDMGIQRQGGQADDYFHLTLRYGALRVMLHAAMIVHQVGPRFVVHGELGSFVKHGLDPQEPQLLQGMVPGDAGWGVEAESLHGTLSFIKDGMTVSGKVASVAGCYETYYQAVWAAIVEGGPVPAAGREVINVIKVLELALRSHAEQRVLPFA